MVFQMYCIPVLQNFKLTSMKSLRKWLALGVIFYFCFIYWNLREEKLSEEDAYKAYQGSVSRGSLISLCVREKLAIVLSLQLSSLSLTPLLFQVHSSLVLQLFPLFLGSKHFFIAGPPR